MKNMANLSSILLVLFLFPTTSSAVIPEGITSTDRAGEIFFYFFTRPPTRGLLLHSMDYGQTHTVPLDSIEAGNIQFHHPSSKLIFSGRNENRELLFSSDYCETIDTILIREPFGIQHTLIPNSDSLVYYKSHPYWSFDTLQSDWRPENLTHLFDIIDLVGGWVPGEIYSLVAAADTTHMYCSYDYGETQNLIASSFDLPYDENIQRLTGWLFRGFAPGEFYCYTQATNLWMYATTDFGATWERKHRFDEYGQDPSNVVQLFPGLFPGSLYAWWSRPFNFLAIGYSDDFGENWMFTEYDRWETTVEEVETTLHPVPLDVFPNPTNGWITVDGLLTKNNTPGKLVVTDILGRTVRVLPLPHNQNAMSIDLKNLSAGSYFIHLGDKDAQHIKLLH
ncbi:T9SS type A sorting domain-containing protein [bacterium]|nr:T9SS type A sorting domain-containing protein [bacterium]